jgi:benzoyl-CoA-dihydrodiol lyase
MTEVPVTFDVDPTRLRHWCLEIASPLATLRIRVTPSAALRDDYELKLNSYDLGVDIELNDIVQRLRFEHPEVGAVVLTGGIEKVFCAGANIQMLAGSTHHHKVNFCKFTNETRNAIEDATNHSHQVWLAAVNGTAAGGGYELALACDEILLVDDHTSAVSLPEVPLLAVLPGTGGLTRVVDKRHVRRDLADVFATRAEGVKGDQAVEWGLVDAIAPRSRFDDLVQTRAMARAAESDRPAGVAGVALIPLDRETTGDRIAYDHVRVDLDRDGGIARLTICGPSTAQPTDPAGLDATSWLLAAARQFDDAILWLRFNEPEIGTWVLRTEGDLSAVLAAEEIVRTTGDHWLVREIRLLWARTFRRLDLSARSLIALIEPGSCFAGTLSELALAVDRSFMFDGAGLDDDGAPAALELSDANDGWYPMSNGLSRLESRFWRRPAELERARDLVGKPILAAEAQAAGLVTFSPDELDWDDEVRVALEERASFSPDALSGLEANLRFVGPETMETKIFGRLTAWQNWIFQRPNAVGPEGALRRFGTGARPSYDRKRV